ncbi:MAG TPA: hypothetical protein VHK25_00775 [Acidimicrobiales bacterium]|nr:hypothetical protein [Acidimicrobiales bacterium]
MRIEIQQRQTQQAGTDAPIDHPVSPTRDRKPVDAPPAMTHQVCFCRFADTLELAATRAATLLTAPAAVASARQDGIRRPAAPTIRSFLLLRRNNMV